MTILVTGATGAVGRHVTQHLLATGATVRCLSRGPARPAGVEWVQGDLSSAAVPPRAFEGVRRLFLFPATGGVADFLAQAARAGVEHVVVLSSLAAALEHERDRGSASSRHHLAIERAARASGLTTTMLRPGTFANNLLAWAAPLRAGEVVTGPFPTSAQAPVHEADVAAVAVAALTQGGHEGQTYALTGPQALTRVQQLETIGAALGRRLTFAPCSPEAFAASVQRFMPADLISMLLAYWSDTVAAPDVVRPTIEQVTGRPARTLLDWARDHAGDFR